MLIGVDLGGTTIKTGLVDLEGNIIRQDVNLFYCLNLMTFYLKS